MPPLLQADRKKRMLELLQDMEAPSEATVSEETKPTSGSRKIKLSLLDIVNQARQDELSKLNPGTSEA